MTLLCLSVNGICAEHKKQENEKNDRMRALVERLLTYGWEDTVFSGRLAQLLELPDPAPTKSDEFNPEENPDQVTRGGSLLVDKSTTGALIPLKLIIKVRKESGRDGESYNFVSSLDGDLQVALVSHDKLKEDLSDVIHGSGVGSRLDISAPETKRRFNHELEFWLEGKHWKKAALKKRCETFEYEPPFCWGIKPKAKKAYAAKTTKPAEPASVPASRPVAE